MGLDTARAILKGQPSSIARGKAAKAATLVDRLIADILGFSADAVAERHERLMQQAEVRMRDLSQWKAAAALLKSDPQAVVEIG